MLYRPTGRARSLLGSDRSDSCGAPRPKPMLHPPRVYLYLDTVASCGSIRKAAEQLHVASTALNRKILEVEQQIGTPLFERLPRACG